MGSRLLLWSGSVIVTGSAVGMGWMMSTVQIPISWLLLLTFVPTTELIDVIRSNLNRLKRGDDSR